MSIDYLELAKKKFDITFTEHVPLAPYSTWKIGGPARYFVIAHTQEDTIKALEFAKKRSLPVFILGGGSNILISDQGFDGLIIKMEVGKLVVEGNRITTGAGVAMGRLAAFSMQQNLAGLEWAVGIPGTVGGAVSGNSNCFGGSTGQHLKEALIMDTEGKSRIVDKGYFNFSYDYSKLQDTHEALLEATFELEPVDAATMARIRQQVAQVAAERARHQPLGAKCAGSTFKAIVPKPEIIPHLNRVLPAWRRGLRDGFLSAGYIIDHGLGLKGYVLDKMKISDLHANFFINLGGATAKNAQALIDFVKTTCKNKLGIALEEEIKYVGSFN